MMMEGRIDVLHLQTMSCWKDLVVPLKLNLGCSMGRTYFSFQPLGCDTSQGDIAMITGLCCVRVYEDICPQLTRNTCDEKRGV